MRVRIRWTRRPWLTLLSDPGALAERQPRWPAFCASASLHWSAVVIAAALPIGVRVVANAPVKPETPVRMVELALPRPAFKVFLVPSGTGSAGKPAARAAARGGSAAPRAAGGPTASAAPRTMRTEQVLLQPDTAARLSQELRVPEMTILVPQTMRRTLIRPPEATDVKPVPSQPLAELASRELSDAAAGVAKAALVPQTPPALSVPEGRPAPLGVDAAGAPPKPAATVRGTNPEPANIISIPDRAIPPAQVVAVPEGNQGIGEKRPSEAADGPVGGKQERVESAKPRATAGGAAAAPVEGQGSGTGAGPGTATGPAAGPGAGTAANGSAAGAANGAVPGTARGTGTGGGGTAGQAGVTGGNVSLGPGATGLTPGTGGGEIAGFERITRPANSPKDFVLTGSESALPGSAGLLSGRPVYTVYLPMRTAKDWILQYCVSAQSGPAERNGNIVQLGEATVVDSPFALVMYRPKIRLRPGYRWAFIHGWINVQGKPEELREAGPKALSEPEVALEALRNWEFRPAMRGPTPMKVEILLAIPAF